MGLIMINARCRNRFPLVISRWIEGFLRGILLFRRFPRNSAWNGRLMDRCLSDRNESLIGVIAAPCFVPRIVSHRSNFQNAFMKCESTFHSIRDWPPAARPWQVELLRHGSDRLRHWTSIKFQTSASTFPFTCIVVENICWKNPCFLISRIRKIHHGKFYMLYEKILRTYFALMRLWDFKAIFPLWKCITFLPLSKRVVYSLTNSSIRIYWFFKIAYGHLS